MVELSNLLVLSLVQVNIHQLFHYNLALLSAKMRNHVSSHQCDSLLSDKFVKAGQDKVWIGSSWIAFVLINPGQNKGFFLALTYHYKVRVVLQLWNG